MFRAPKKGASWRYDTCECGNRKDKRVPQCRECYYKSVGITDVTKYVKRVRANEAPETTTISIELATNSAEHMALRELLDSRGENRAGTLKQCLLDWIVLMQEERRALNLEEEDAVILVHALRDTAYERASYYVLPALVERHLKLIPHPKVDTAEFLTRVRSWRPGQAASVIDGVRTFWLYRERYGKMPFRDSLYDVGLVSYEPAGYEED